MRELQTIIAVFGIWSHDRQTYEYSNTRYKKKRWICALCCIISLSTYTVITLKKTLFNTIIIHLPAHVLFINCLQAIIQKYFQITNITFLTKHCKILFMA